MGSKTVEKQDNILKLNKLQILHRILMLQRNNIE